MSLAKIVISGTVYRKPEMRFTKNDFPITSFALNMDEKEESLIRVVAKGNMAKTVEQNVQQGTKIVIDGRLQTNTLPDESGSERKILEIELQSFELLSNSQIISNTTDKSEVVKFSETEESAENLIGEEEIPF